MSVRVDLRQQQAKSKLLINSYNAVLYEQILKIIGPSAVICVMGDGLHSAANTTFKTIGVQELTFTWSETLSAFDVQTPDIELIPIITFNGSDEEADTPDNDLWSRTVGGSDQAFSVGAWVKFDTTVTQTIMAKFAGDNNREWWLRMASPLVPHWIMYNITPSPRIARKAPGLSIDTWYFIVGTYDGSETSSGLKIYVDATRTDNSDDNSGAYLGMGNLTAAVTIGFLNPASGSFFDGKMAGGPLSPFFAPGELSNDGVKRLYEIGRRALAL